MGMKDFTKNMITGDLIPVFLGITAKSIGIARLIFRAHGTTSHIFCDRVPLMLRLSWFLKFHTAGHTRNEELMVQALIDFANQLDNKDAVLYLIPSTKDYIKAVAEHRPLLESRYVLATKKDLEVLTPREPLKEGDAL